MVWESMKNQTAKVAGWNRWPAPHNWITDIKVLVCNQDTVIMQIKLAFALAAEMFWTSFVPSPREVERKFFTGGYRCGFYLDVKFKSPVEIIFGRGTSTVIAEVARPFATGLFYFWLQQTAITALSSFTTLIYPMLYCEDGIGDGLRRGDRGSISQGSQEGCPGLGVYMFDRWGFMNLTDAGVFLPPGYFHVYVAWFVEPSGNPFTHLNLGLGLNGVAWHMHTMDPPTPGLPSIHITEEYGHLPDGGAVQAWVQGGKPPGSFPSLVWATMFTYSWSLVPFDSSIVQPADPNMPQFGPRVSPKCGWLD